MTDNTRRLECEEAIRLLLEYLDSELDADNNAAMQAHLQTCRACYSRMEFERRLKEIARNVKNQTAPVSLRARVRKITEGF